MRNQRQRKKPVAQMPARPLPPGLGGDPAGDDPHGDPEDAIDQELLGIWLGLSRLRQLIQTRLPRTSHARRTAPQRPSERKKPRRKAA